MAEEAKKKEISNKRRSRTSIINHINKLFSTRIDELQKNYRASEDLVQLVGYKNIIEKKLETVYKLSHEITESIEVEVTYQTEMESFMDTEIRLVQAVNNLSHFIKSKTEQGERVLVKKENSETKEKSEEKGHIRLPKFILKKFNGDPTEWQGFHDSFYAAVDSDKSLSNIEKMNYLIGYLSGDAEATIKGLQLKNENYTVAMEILEKRFGDKQLLVSSHMTKLLSLENIVSVANTVGMRKLYDERTSQVRNLENLGLNATNSGPILAPMPVLMSKLPEQLKLIISREFCNEEIWDINKVLNKFKVEIQAREKVGFVASEHSRNSVEQPFSGAAFNVHSGRLDFARGRFSGGGRHRNSRNRDNYTPRITNGNVRSNYQGNFERSMTRMNERNKCVFCGQQHNAKFCVNVTRPETRKQI